MSDCADENSERKWFDVELQLQFEQVTLQRCVKCPRVL